jgi:Gpi18-like mannosyltransferase
MDQTQSRILYSPQTPSREIVPYCIGGILLCTSLFIRIISYPIQTSDYQYFVKVWYGLLASEPGLGAFKTTFANYAPLYLYFIKGLTFLSALPPLLSVKLLSALFDVIIALIICAILRATHEERFSTSRLFLTFAIVVSIPTLILNSSLWAQCDALYAAGIVGSLYFIMKDKPLASTLAYAFAFCLKLQAVFFLPILLGYLLAKRFKVLYILFVPALFALSIVPAWLAGGSYSSWAAEYVFQTGQYSYINLNSPSVFAFVDVLHLSAFLQNILGYIGIALAALAALALIYYAYRLFSNNAEESTGPTTASPIPSNFPAPILRLSLLCVLALPFLLPHMHERYFYLGDVFATLYALYDARKWYFAVLTVGASFFSYLVYLSGYVSFFTKIQIPLWVAACAVIVSLLLLIVPERLFAANTRRLIRFPRRSLQF